MITIPYLHILLFFVAVAVAYYGLRYLESPPLWIKVFWVIVGIIAALIILNMFGGTGTITINP